MEQVFLRVLETGLAAGGMILLVLVLCFALKRAPKMVSYVLWIAVFLRLACPVEFVSPVGLMPSIHLDGNGMTVTGFRHKSQRKFMWSEQDVIKTQENDFSNSGKELLEDGKHGGNQGGETGQAGESIKKAVDEKEENTTSGSEVLSEQEKTSSQTVFYGAEGNLHEHNFEGEDLDYPQERGFKRFKLLMFLWGVGVFAMGLYGIWQAVKLKKVLVDSRPWSEADIDENSIMDGTGRNRTLHGKVQRIYVSDRISVPFVFGVIRPSIYLSADLPEESRSYVLLHEQTHIRHRDYLVKYAAYILLCLYWFQPLVWLAYWMLEKNMEFACDESVLAHLGGEKKQYSTALLTLASGYGKERGKQGLPIAFSEKNTSSRIHNIVRYKRPRRIAVAILGVLVLVVVFCLMTNRGDHNRGTSDETEITEETQEDAVPCIVLNEDNNFIGTKRFGKIRAIEFSWSCFPAFNPDKQVKYSILENTFSGCEQLEQVIVYYDDIEYVAENAFDGCSENLVVYCAKDTYLQKRLQEIGVAWKDLEEVEQETDLQTTPCMLMTEKGEVIAASNNFDNYSEEVTVTFPPETKKIGDYAFNNFGLLDTVVIPEGVTEIGEGAFSCSNLKKVVFEGNKVKKIGRNAFLGTILEELELPEGVEEIGKSAFSINQENVKRFTLPSSLKKMEEAAVSIPGLQELIVLNPHVEYLGDMVLPAMGENGTVFCYRGSTTEGYLQSHGYRTKIKYLKEIDGLEKEDNYGGQNNQGSTSKSLTDLDRERQKAIDAVTSSVNGHGEGDMTFNDEPWEIHWWADVTGDRLPDEIVVTTKKHKKYIVTVFDSASASASGDGKKREIWRWEKEIDETFGRKLGLYYQDGKTYLAEWNFTLDKKMTAVAYQVFQLDGGELNKAGRKKILAKEEMAYPSSQWEKYQDKEQELVKRGHKYTKASDLILGEWYRGVLCSVPLMKLNMYGFEEEH